MDNEYKLRRVAFYWAAGFATLIYVWFFALLTTMSCSDTRKACTCDTDCPEVSTDLTVEHSTDILDAPVTVVIEEDPDATD